MIPPLGTPTHHNTPSSDWSHSEDCDEASSPNQPNLALGALLISILVAIITVAVLLFVGRPVLQTILITIAVQFAVFATTLVWGLNRRLSEELVAAKAGNTADGPLDTATIWDRYLDDDNATPPFRIAFISCDEAHSRDLAKTLASLRHRVFFSGRYEEMVARVASHPERWDLVIFDLDLAPDLETGVETLIQFRAHCPDVPVLLLSDAVQRDEMSHYRRAIGDATLRKPVTGMRLLQGLTAVGQNFLAKR